jgi:hypothetical protein
MSGRWGASPEEWAHWDLVLGLTDDLLPVVSNPHAQISERSTLRTLGKSPSVYNRQHHVTGIPEWPLRVTDGLDIEDWAKVADYGLFLQTRRVRALDIDVPDRAKSTAIVEFVRDFTVLCGVKLPRRWRADSGKQLLAFELVGDWTKRVVPVDGGIVEVLMHGQGFVAAGTHQDGERYQWDGGLPGDFPELSGEQFEALYAGLVERFAVGKPTEVRRVVRGADLGVDDEIAAWLVENWETFGADREGRRLFVRCPWKDAEHSMDSGETEAAWLMRGTGGLQQGHFRCLHAHCNARGRDEFLGAVGYVESGFDDISDAKTLNGHAVGEVNGLPVPWPVLERMKHKGVEVPVGSLLNTYLVAQRADIMGVRIALDSFRAELVRAPELTDRWEPIDDDCITAFRLHLQDKLRFQQIPHDTMRQVVSRVGKDNMIDSAQQWLLKLPTWDGVKRIERFMAEYMGCAESDYASAVGVYMWTAHAGRIMDPGCKADMAPILVGGQGIGKSRGVAAISPSPEYFVEIGFHEKEDDLSRKMRGTLVAEIAELRGLNSRDAQTIKAQMSRQYEKWTPKFKEFKTAFPRRLMFWGTSNEEEVLADSTGERRWLPILVEREVDVAAIERDRDQLWAEGLVRWRAEGIVWHPAQKLGASEHSKFKVTDPWEDRIAAWLDEPDFAGKTPRGGDGFTMEVVVTTVLGMDFSRFSKKEEMRIGKILRGLGLVRVVKWVDGKSRRVWV